MKQFDIPKKSKQKDDGWDKAFDALDTLADELETDSDNDEASNDEHGAEENNNREIEEGTFDGREGMTAEEVRDLEMTVKPVQRVLVKVC
jgi:hypothetical protein